MLRFAPFLIAMFLIAVIPPRAQSSPDAAPLTSVRDADALLDLPSTDRQTVAVTVAVVAVDPSGEPFCDKKWLESAAMKPIALTLTTMLLFAAFPRAQTAPVAVQPPPPTPGAISLQTSPYKQETVEIKLAPKEGMEYKYELDKGQALLYSWTSTAPVHYELHSEPTAGPKGYAEFFDQQDDREQAHGSYVAPFAGVHGWFWENRTDRELTVRLTTSGFYSGSLEFRRAQPVKRKTF